MAQASDKDKHRIQYAEEIPIKHFAPSSDVIRLNNGINRGLEQPDHPKEIIQQIFEGEILDWETEEEEYDD